MLFMKVDATNFLLNYNVIVIVVSKERSNLPSYILRYTELNPSVVVDQQWLHSAGPVIHVCAIGLVT